MSVLGPSGRFAGGALRRDAAEDASYDDDDADTSVELGASFGVLFCTHDFHAAVEGITWDSSDHPMSMFVCVTC